MSFELVLGDLGDGAGRAGLLAGAAGDAGVGVDDLGVLVAELQDAGGAGVNANAAGDALVSIDYGVSHDRSLLQKSHSNVNPSCWSSKKVNLGNLSSCSFR